jgi:hypothetical protein
LSARETRGKIFLILLIYKCQCLNNYREATEFSLFVPKLFVLYRNMDSYAMKLVMSSSEIIYVSYLVDILHTRFLGLQTEG